MNGHPPAAGPVGVMVVDEASELRRGAPRAQSPTGRSRRAAEPMDGGERSGTLGAGTGWRRWDFRAPAHGERR